MTKRFPLQTLVEVTQRRAEETERQLHTLKDRLRAAEEKLEQLIGYRREYETRLQRSTQVGLSVSQWRDYQAFLGKLETAITQQAEEISRCRARWEEGRREWLHERSRLQAYDTLAQRHEQNERKREAKLEQREQDEHAQKVARVPRTDSQ